MLTFIVLFCEVDSVTVLPVLVGIPVTIIVFGITILISEVQGLKKLPNLPLKASRQCSIREFLLHHVFYLPHRLKYLGKRESWPFLIGCHLTDVRGYSRYSVAPQTSKF